MGLGENIFMTAEEVMDRWGIVDPHDFIGMLSFVPLSKGELNAYEQYSREPADYFGRSGKMDFSEMEDFAGRLEPICLKYLLFKFSDVEECERNDPGLLRYANWAKGYRQNTGQTAKQVLDELDRKHKESLARIRKDNTDKDKLILDVAEPGDDRNAEGGGTEKHFNEGSLPVTEENGEDEIIHSDHAIDKSGRKGLKKNQIARARCRVIAELILEDLPELRIAQLIKSRYIKELACNVDVESDSGNEFVKEKLLLSEGTLQDFVRDLCKVKAIGALSKEEKNKKIEIVVSLVDE